MTWDSETIIVVVDDNYFMRQLLVDTLTLSGAGAERIRSFANCAEARVCLQEEACTHAVIVCDIVMQESIGFELYESAHTRAPDLKFVFIGDPQPARLERRVVKDESLNILEKPFTPAELVAAVQEVSDKRKTRPS